MTHALKEELILDVDSIREDILDGNPLHGTDASYTFYHDETNNIRKLLLTESGINNPDPKIFVLGGIVYRPSVVPDWSGLLRRLELQPTVKELKLKHLGKGDFLELATSKKIAMLLKWLTQRNIHIHSTTVDVLYWSVVDIIDSIIANRLNDPRIVRHRFYKNLIYRVLNANIVATANLFFSFDYPDVATGKTREFLECLLVEVERASVVLSAEQRESLGALLKDGLNDPELNFIQQEEKHVLLPGFEAFYRHVICLFRNSNHLLDREDLVAERLLETPLTENGALFTGYKFLDSKSDLGIQVADVVVGILGKYWTYLHKTGYETIRADLKNLSVNQRATVAAIKRAFDVSDRVSDGFFNCIVCDDDVDKHRSFLWGIPRQE